MHGDCNVFPFREERRDSQRRRRKLLQREESLLVLSPPPEKTGSEFRKSPQRHVAASETRVEEEEEESLWGKMHLHHATSLLPLTRYSPPSSPFRTSYTSQRESCNKKESAQKKPGKPTFLINFEGNSTLSTLYFFLFSPHGAVCRREPLNFRTLSFSPEENIFYQGNDVGSIVQVCRAP